VIVLHRGRIRFAGPPGELIRRAEGRVGRLHVTGTREPALDGRCQVTGRVVTSDGVVFRLVGDQLPDGCEPVSPSLEDAYVHCMQNGKTP
jgi:hypothetical protein